MICFCIIISTINVLYVTQVCSTHTATIRLTGRNEGIFDGIALGDVAQYIIHTLEEVSI